MDIHKIEILIRAIELGSMSKAAKEFLYTPSAVSHIFDTIENEIGIRFIKRGYSGIEVEDGCEEIVRNLKNIVSLEKRTKQIAYDKQNTKKELTVATYASLSKHIMAKIMKGYNKKAPDVHINLVVCNDLRKTYEEKKPDILFGENVCGEGVCWDELIVDPYVAVFPGGYEICGNVIERDELYKYPFIKANDSKITKYIDENKIENIIRVDSHDDSSVLCMVKEELGITVLPMLSVFGNKDVKCIRTEPGVSRVLGLTYNESDFNARRELRAFVEYIKSYDFNKCEVTQNMKRT